MAISNWSGPIRSENGFIQPLVYVFANSADVDDNVYVEAGAQVIILSAADGGPASSINIVLPLVKTINDGIFTITNADPNVTGIRGSVLNYDAAIDHVLIGADDGNQNQPVNGSTTGVDIAHGTIVQWGGNGNPAAPWAAITSDLAPAA
jgi:hypothetical protein